MLPDPRHSLIALRKRAGSIVAEQFFLQVARAASNLPQARPERHRVEVLRDIAYADGGHRHHLLDIYRPIAGGAHGNGPWPVVFYVHGGGFRILSKETHWVMGLAFARRGYLVASINYRLAPRHPFPAALEDTTSAWLWLLRSIAAYGGDPGRIAVAGESAGGNLVTSLTLAACYERPEPYAREVYARGVVPRAALPACPILQVSDVHRFQRRKRMPSWLFDRILEVNEAYLSAADLHAPGGLDLADPLLVLERGDKPARPLPPFFVPVGTADPLLDDTRRVKAALDRLGVRCEARYYRGQPHAFHAFILQREARQCWRDCYAFLEETMTMADGLARAS